MPKGKKDSIIAFHVVFLSIFVEAIINYSVTVRSGCKMWYNFLINFSKTSNFIRIAYFLNAKK